MYKVMTHIIETVQHALFEYRYPVPLQIFPCYFFITLGSFVCFVINNCESLCVQYVLILLGHNIFKKKLAL